MRHSGIQVVVTLLVVAAEPAGSKIRIPKTPATQPSEATAGTATLMAAAEVRSGAPFPLEWTGPGDTEDYLRYIQGRSRTILARRPIEVR